DIAQEEGLRLENLLGYNFLKAGMQPAIGEKLYLHTSAASMPKLQTASNESSATRQVMEHEIVQPMYIVHTVQPKETAYGIAKKYLIGLEELMKWNALASETLKTGQQLRIPKK
ncbi:MAG: LysM peptidoglycan-binding domain-containing protein, partial [Flavisolibacter sp.]